MKRTAKRFLAFLLTALMSVGMAAFSAPAMAEEIGPGINMGQSQPSANIQMVQAVPGGPGDSTGTQQTAAAGTGAASSNVSASVAYSMEFQGKGWSREMTDGSDVFYTSTYPTAFRARIASQPAGMSGTIQYAVNVSGYGWTGTFENNAVAGNEGGTAVLEGVRVWLNGDLSQNFDVYTKVMVGGQWLDWAANGADAGKIGEGKHIDGIRIAIVPKGQEPPTVSSSYAFSGAAVDPSRPMVALTFDDGPGKYENRILDCLQANGARATWFLVGNLVGNHADAVQRMASLGCEVGNHSWNHDNLSKLSTDGVINSVTKANNAISAVIGHPATVVRPPYGATGGNCKGALAQMGYASILWNIDTLDWKTKNADNTVSVVLNQVKDGDIILMHSIYEASAAAAERIIPALVARGYQLVTVSEMANARGGMQPGVNYGKFR